MPNVIPPEVPGPVAGASGHFPHHDWLTASVKALDLNVPGAWTPWTPAIQHSTANPVLGTGSVQVGKYARIGKVVIAQAFVAYGTSGVVAGGGTMRLTLPFTIKTPGAAVADLVLPAVVLCRDASANVACFAFLRPSVTDGLGFITPIYTSGYPTGTLAAMSASAPWVWAASDSVGWSIVYETGDA